ncbi:hypothetical protein [Lederbergia lenta]|uniref:hypothetical protein n=1 Tax=Lederbergia lenta TaxID=1467 RepID=UPI002040C6A0|nr:hypothetical protein [Lederbergia lenta]MCM3111751.1 hypothetical protein [Lederbergia lenta]
MKFILNEGKFDLNENETTSSENELDLNENQTILYENEDRKMRTNSNVPLHKTNMTPIFIVNGGESQWTS